MIVILFDNFGCESWFAIISKSETNRLTLKQKNPFGKYHQHDKEGKMTFAAVISKCSRQKYVLYVDE